MSRPTTFLVDGTVYWTINTYDGNGVLVDADSNPYVDIRRNGTLLPLDVATISKRGGATGTYDCQYNPSTDTEGDCYQFEETITISSQAYKNTWNCVVVAEVAVAPSASEVADAVWDETQAAHTTAGTFGEYLDSQVSLAGGGSAPTVGQIADAVWDEAASGHATLGTFGYLLLTNPTVAQIADGVWDENWVNHTSSSTFGGRIDVQLSDLPADTADAVWDESTISHQGANTFGGNLDAAVSDAVSPTTAAIADAVWDESSVGHTLAGSFGLKVGSLSAFSVQDIVDGVWDETQSNHITAGTFGLYLDSQVSNAGGGSLTVQDIVDGVWDEVYTTHNTFNSFATLVTTSGSAANTFNAMLEVDGLGGKQYTAISLENAPSGGGGGDATLANQTTILANQATILADTNELQTNQGQWLTATSTTASNAPANWSTLIVGTGADAGKVTTSNPAAGGGSAHTAADVAALILSVPTTPLTNTVAGALANVDLVDVVTANTDMRGTDGANTVVPVDVSSDVSAIKSKTDQFVFSVAGQVDANALTGGGGDDAATIYTYFTAGTNEDAFKADVSLLATETNVDNVGTIAGQTYSAVLALNDFDPANDIVGTVAVCFSNTDMRGTDSALLASSAPSNWSTLIVGTGVDAGKVTTSNPAAGGGSAHTAQDVANLILAVPTTPLGNTATGSIALVDVTTDLTNGGSGGGATPEEIYTYFTAGSNEDVFKADVTLLATSASIAALNDFDPALDTVAHVTLVDTTTNLTNGGGGGGDCPTAQEIVDTWGNQPQGVYTTSGTLGYYLDAQVSTAGSGGTGLYQATVRVQDNDLNSLQGARVNIDGTTLTLTTNTSGEVTFNLDSGVYLLEVSPPAGYTTPSGQVLTVLTSDPSDTVFTILSTVDPEGCSPPWIG